jgi:hypothetical protein
MDYSKFFIYLINWWNYFESLIYIMESENMPKINWNKILIQTIVLWKNMVKYKLQLYNEPIHSTSIIWN